MFLWRRPAPKKSRQKKQSGRVTARSIGRTTRMDAGCGDALPTRDMDDGDRHCDGSTQRATRRQLAIAAIAVPVAHCAAPVCAAFVRVSAPTGDSTRLPTTQQDAAMSRRSWQSVTLPPPRLSRPPQPQQPSAISPAHWSTRWSLTLCADAYHR